jgi:hypothetical protein
MKRIAITTAVLACLLTAVFAIGTFADAFVFIAPIVGTNPGLTIAGLKSGGAVLDDNGDVRADVRGLLLPSTGTTGPITQVAATVVCFSATGATVAGTTKSANLSAAGNARIRGKVTVPSPCFAPVVLIQATGINNAPVTGGPFIAVTGTAKDANDKDTQDNDLNDDNGHDNNDH